MTTYDLPKISNRRRLTNTITAKVIGAGGVAVIAAIVLIMGYLFWVILPIFAPTSIEVLDEVSQLPEDVLAIGSDDSFEIVTLIRGNGRVEFRNPSTFEVENFVDVSSTPWRDAILVFPTTDTYAVRDSANEVRFFRIAHQVRYIDNERVLEQRVEPVFVNSSYQLPPNTDDFDAYRSDEDLRIVARLNEGSLLLVEFEEVDDDFELEFPDENTIAGRVGTDRTFFGPRGRFLYNINSETGDYQLILVPSVLRPRVVQSSSFAVDGRAPTAVEPLLGRYSILVGHDSGEVRQWSLSPSEIGTILKPIRSMDFDAPISALASEQRRKGFVAVDNQRTAHLAYTTSNRILTSIQLEAMPKLLVFSPRADRLVTYQDDQIHTYAIENDHPEISWSSLWGKVWYEGYEEPVFSWQSSSADTDFEPKFSLTPLLFGTLKAAFYAMIFAIPIAVAGAIYTANFMAPGMRAWVKPGIEIMAALPTVILGFLAGLWLAPIVEDHLTSVLLCVFVLPVGMLVFATLWSRMPSKVLSVCDGWFAAIAVPVIVLLIWLTLEFDQPLANVFFGGDAKSWMYEKLGLEYDQRNALIIGIAMGLAVIPTIFSIAEDAIYGVPQHLVHGSLALGATRWQTLVRVVLLTASPGIFSAIMIGFGRAVGETMIVLMATGNTPIMDLNLFQGMRTFAANIAVEMPESEANSTHFRILFLMALVLFFITFMFNTVAEIVRNRLRTRYGNL
ncbi:MAG: ABC transporter permease subunit [Gammaproteobacteria bacterium]|nr:ABC transporter permease subunit [Gammaproteobacteria bacterium]